MQGVSIAKQAEVAARRTEAVRLRARGVPYPDIAKRLGCSEEVARQDVSRAHKLRAQELRDGVDELIAEQVEEIDSLRAMAWRIAASNHRKVGASGAASRDEQGNPIYDLTVNLQAIDKIIKLEERKSKLLGLDAALKVDMKTQVVTVDAIDAAIIGLREQLEAERASGTSG